MEIPTKTEKMIALWKEGKKQEAIAILHTFKLGFTKEEKEFIKICHEMNHSVKFYEALGYNWDSVKRIAFDIVERNT